MASGPNSASPHHDPGDRVIREHETVVCDFGAEFALPGEIFGYCSDITRTLFTGQPSPEIAECYEVLQRAQAAGVNAVRAGIAAEEVDAVARRVIDEAGYGKYFVHRTGHGIGIEEHEDPYIVEGNPSLLTTGNAFSIEPGIYVPDSFGMRLEDIVIVDGDGFEQLNLANHGLATLAI